MKGAGGYDDFFGRGEGEGNAAEVADINLDARGGFGAVENNALGERGLVDYQIRTSEAVFAKKRSFRGVPFQCSAVDCQELVGGT